MMSTTCSATSAFSGSQQLTHHVGKIEVLGSPSFNPRENFRVGQVGKKFEILSMGPNFERMLLDKVEKDICPATLHIDQVRGDISTQGLKDKFGRAYETKLTHFWQLLQKASILEGCLLGGSYAAFVRAENGTLWIVVAQRQSRSAGWTLDALEFKPLFTWFFGRNFISCRQSD